jgi:hypothetical protein
MRNGEETSRASCGPDLSAREGGRRPHRIIFRASSSSPRIVFRALKKLPPMDIQPHGETS